jgi:hypothetical protein
MSSYEYPSIFGNITYTGPLPAGLTPTATDLNLLPVIDTIENMSDSDKEILKIQIKLNSIYGGNIPSFSVQIPAPQLPAPRITIMDFASLLAAAKAALKEQADTSDATDPLLNKDMWYENSIFAGLGLSGFFNRLMANTSSEESSFFSLQQQQIASYNNGQISTAAFNLLVDNNNKMIAQLNATRSKLGITAQIPLQQHATAAPVSYSSIVSTSLAMTPQSNDETTFFAALKASYDQINNGPLKNYNQTVAATASAVQTMNQAIAAYQAGTITTAQYNAAVNSYTAYINGVNSTLTTRINSYISAVNALNSQVEARNIQIGQFNTSRTAPNLIPYQQMTPVPTVSSMLIPLNIPLAPPVPQANFSVAMAPLALPLTPAGSATPTAENTFLTSFFGAGLPSDFAIQFDAYANMLTREETYRSTVLFNLKGKHNLIPNGAFIQEIPNQLMNSGSPTGAASGVGLSTIALGFSNKTLQTSITNSMISAFQDQQLVPLTQKAIDGLTQKSVDNISSYALQLLQRAGLFNILPQLRALAASPNASATGNAAAAAGALGLLNTVRSLVEGSTLKEGIAQILTANGFTPQQVAQVVEPLAAAAGMGLLQVALVQMAVALKLPGLLPQLVGNLTSVGTVNTLIGQAATYGLTDLLATPPLAGLMKLQLAKQLVAQNEGYSQEQAQTLINEAVNSAAANAQNSEEAFRTALNSELINRGISDATALRLSDEAVSLARQELMLRDLDTTFIRNSLNRAELDSEVFQQQGIAQAVANTMKERDLLTRRDFRDRLVQELVNQGQSAAQANAQANQVLLATQSNEIKQLFNSDRIRRDLLNQSLMDQLTTATVRAHADAQAEITAALNAVASEQFNNEKLYREALQTQLQQQGFDLQTASRLSGNAILAQKGIDPLRYSGSAELLSRQELESKLLNEVSNRLSPELGQQRADQLAKSFVAALVGQQEAMTALTANEPFRPQSALNLLQTFVKTISSEKQHRYEKSLQDNFLEVIKAPYDLIQIAHRISDPGTAIAAAVGIMSQGMDGAPSSSRPDFYHKRGVEGPV